MSSGQREEVVGTCSDPENCWVAVSQSDVNPADLAPDRIAWAETSAGVERLSNSILFCPCVTGRVTGS